MMLFKETVMFCDKMLIVFGIIYCTGNPEDIDLWRNLY